MSSVGGQACRAGLKRDVLQQRGEDVPELDILYHEWMRKSAEALGARGCSGEEIEACRAALTYDDAIYRAAERGIRRIYDDPTLDSLYDRWFVLATDLAAEGVAAEGVAAEGGS